MRESQETEMNLAKKPRELAGDRWFNVMRAAVTAHATFKRDNATFT
jgi:hypothetical protein